MMRRATANLLVCAGLDVLGLWIWFVDRRKIWLTEEHLKIIKRVEEELWTEM